ncbi:hypothetical protein HPB49_022363 [Dermacentor silvarum]|uniref:Uncharacterized protein n=1 Tax=Dermacentor silvarum TaxID=543639 RepID=A0ACB8DL97_DERSI|nr:hypothetical protein HPB49_022363 [Dermacentor silvarum]
MPSVRSSTPSQEAFLPLSPPPLHRYSKERGRLLSTRDPRLSASQECGKAEINEVYWDEMCTSTIAPDRFSAPEQPTFFEVDSHGVSAYKVAPPEEKLRKSAPSRIVNVSSDSHCSGDVSQLEAKARGRCTLRTPFSVYSNSKLAMSLYTVALADKLKNTGVTVNSLNPGLVQTPIASHGSLLRKLIIQVGLFIKGKFFLQRKLKKRNLNVNFNPSP